MFARCASYARLATGLRFFHEKKPSGPSHTNKEPSHQNQDGSTKPKRIWVQSPSFHMPDCSQGEHPPIQSDPTQEPRSPGKRK